MTHFLHGHGLCLIKYGERVEIGVPDGSEVQTIFALFCNANGIALSSVLAAALPLSILDQGPIARGRSAVLDSIQN